MRSVSHCLFLLLLLASCHGKPEHSAASRAGKDTARQDSLQPVDPNSPARDSRDHPIDTSGDEQEGESLDSIYSQYVALYKHPYVIDSSFVIGGDRFHFYLKHFCLMDSAIRLPKRYTDIYKMDSFVTHNFTTELKMEMNNSVLYEKTVHKVDFNSFLFPEEKKYGVLLSPDFRRSDDTIRLRYSISIPLTDVGVGVTMMISKNGAVSYLR